MERIREIIGSDIERKQSCKSKENALISNSLDCCSAAYQSNIWKFFGK